MAATHFAAQAIGTSIWASTSHSSSRSGSHCSSAASSTTHLTTQICMCGMVTLTFSKHNPMLMRPGDTIQPSPFRPPGSISPISVPYSWRCVWSFNARQLNLFPGSLRQAPRFSDREATSRQNTTQSIPARQNNDQRFVPSDDSIWTGCRLVAVGNVPSFKGQEVQFTSAQVFPESGELQTSVFRLKTQRRSEASNFDSYRDYAMFALT